MKVVVKAAAACSGMGLGYGFNFVSCGLGSSDFDLCGLKPRPIIGDLGSPGPWGTRA